MGFFLANTSIFILLPANFQFLALNQCFSGLSMIYQQRWNTSDVQEKIAIVL